MIELPQDFDSIFRYIVVVSQRAEQLIKGAKPRSESDCAKLTLIARDDVDQGLVPACVNTCEGRARVFGDLNNPDSIVAKLDKEFNLTGKKDKSTLLPGEKTDPHVFYIDPDNILARYKLNKDNKQQEFIGTFE